MRQRVGEVLHRGAEHATAAHVEPTDLLQRGESSCRTVEVERHVPQVELAQRRQCGERFDCGSGDPEFLEHHLLESHPPNGGEELRRVEHAVAGDRQAPQLRHRHQTARDGGVVDGDVEPQFAQAR